ncbi:IS3 family transposase [Streptosporangium saharense]|uniref:IS3 family transposase n=1 Tax=Streptosporangium saharense TaxID=1706840 RepID=UPI003437C40C
MPRSNSSCGSWACPSPPTTDGASAPPGPARGRCPTPCCRRRSTRSGPATSSPTPTAHHYGSPRIHLELRRRGVRVSRKRVERLMRAAGLQGAFMRKGFTTGSTRQDPRHQAAPGLLCRDFSTSAPNRLWVADLTRILTGQGVLWPASVRDAFSNRVVGWKTSDRADTDLVLGALEFALWSRDVRAGQLIHHSDKGCQYTAIRFTQRPADAGIAPSTGSVGDSFDNALAENLWSTIKVELVYRTTWATREEADTTLFRYIDGWYNPRRIQKGLGGLSPDEYEAAWYARQHDLPDSVSSHAELTETT